MQGLIIVGLGGVGRCARQIAMDMGIPVAGFVDDKRPSAAMADYLGDLNWLAEHRRESRVVVAIGDPVTREMVVERLLGMGVNEFPALIHPSCIHPPEWMPGQGSILYPGVIIDPDVSVGRCVIINKVCTLGHDVVIDDFVTLSPAVNLGGAVRVGRGAFFGINSSTVQGLIIGEGAKIGAGATVLNNVSSHTTVVGTPAHPIRRMSQ